MMKGSYSTPEIRQLIFLEKDGERYAGKSAFVLFSYEHMCQYEASESAFFELSLPLCYYYYKPYVLTNVAIISLLLRKLLNRVSSSEIYGDPNVHPQPESYWGNVNTIGPRVSRYIASSV